MGRVMTAADAYSEIAPFYDASYQKPRHRLENAALRSELLYAGLLDGDRILDVGSGTGFLLDLIPEIRPAQYTGIDPAPGMLLRSRQKHPAYRLLRGSWRGLQMRADVSGQFDRIVALWSLAYADSVAGAVQGIASALRPGGRFIAVIYRRPPPADSYALRGIRLERPARVLTLAELRRLLPMTEWDRMRIEPWGGTRLQAFLGRQPYWLVIGTRARR